MKKYADVAGTLRAAAQSFASEVTGGTYPAQEHAYR